MDGTSNNATKKLLGFDYQKLLALESCLNAKENEVIWIECYGDIATNDISTEVKHHLPDSNLNDTHIDFWKTLKNLVKEYNILSNFNRFELLTTSKITSSSIFFNWNSLSSKDKYEKITSVKPNKTILKYYNLILGHDKNELIEILDKFTISGSHPAIEKKYENLKSHASFFIIPEQYIDDFIHKMLGYITMKAIDNMNKWHIERNEFKREMEGFARPFINKDYPFPLVPKKDINKDGLSNFHFISELRKIELQEKIIDNAIMDFLRAERSTFKILRLHSSMADNLEEFDDNLNGDLLLIRENHLSNISNSKLEEFEIISTSKKMYSECIFLKIKKIQGIQEIADYYQKGRIHAIVDRKEFSWQFFEDEK